MILPYFITFIVKYLVCKGTEKPTGLGQQKCWEESPMQDSLVNEKNRACVTIAQANVKILELPEQLTLFIYKHI